MKKILISVSILCLLVINVQGQTEEDRIDELEGLAFDYYDNGQLREAIPYFDTLKSLMPDLYINYEVLSEIYFDLYEFNKGIENLEQGYKLKSERKDYFFYHLLFRYSQTCNEEKELELLNSIPITAENKIEILEAKSNSYRRLGDYDKSIELWKEILELKPNGIDVLYSIGFMYRMTGQEEKSIYLLESALQKKPVGVLKSLILSDLKRYEESIPILDTLIDQSENEIEIAGLLDIKGSILMEQGKFEEGAMIFKKVLGFSNYHGLNNTKKYLAYSEIRNGNYQNALEILDKVLQRNPNDNDAIANRARALMELGELEKALKEVNKAIELRPKKPYAYMVRAMIAYQQNFHEDACIDYFNSVARYGDHLYKTEEFFINIYWICN